MLTGECSGEPRIGVRGAIKPSSFFFLDPLSRGKRESSGAKVDLTREVEVLARL